MISINTLNQINDIMTILNNTRKMARKTQPGSNFAQTIQQVQVQTPAQTVQQATVLPSNLHYSSTFNEICCADGCNNPAVVWVKGKPYCKKHDPDNRIETEED